MEIEGEQVLRVLNKSFTLVDDCELSRTAYRYLLRLSQIET